MRSQRRITTGGAADGIRGALDVSQLVGIDDRHKSNETLSRRHEHVTNKSCNAMHNASEQRTMLRTTELLLPCRCVQRCSATPTPVTSEGSYCGVAPGAHGPPLCWTAAFSQGADPLRQVAAYLPEVPRGRRGAKASTAP